MINKTPVAWFQLIYDKTRLFVTILGVTFAVFLMFIQLGFRDGLFEDSITIPKTLDADLVLIHVNTKNFFDMEPFPQRRLYQLASVDSIYSVSPFYFSVGKFKNPDTAVTRIIPICGFRIDKPVFKLAEITQQLPIIKQENTILFDRLSRSQYGAIALDFQKNGKVTTEISNQKITVGGLFSVGGGVLSSDGLVITSDSNFARILDEPLEKVQMGIIKLKPGIKPENLVKQINLQLPKDVRVMTMEQFMVLEKAYWATATPIGFIFNLGTAIGCIVGGTIVYQILYTQISDNLDIYATLKAIGYAHAYIIKIVVQQSLLMSIIGYLPGLIACLYLYGFVRDATRLPVFMTLDRASIVLILTIIMCCISSLLAMNKLRSADPADLFK
ncbi:MAG: ABC transporter permease DevC [Pleurocapsa sp.]